GGKTEVDGAFRVAVEGRVEKRAIWVGAVRGPRERTVEDVERAGKRQHDAGPAQLPERGENRGEEREQRAHDGDLVGRHGQATERRHQSLGVTADPGLKPRREHGSPPDLARPRAPLRTPRPPARRPTTTSTAGPSRFQPRPCAAAARGRGPG